MKQTGETQKDVQSHFEEVLYTREFQQGVVPHSRTAIIKLYQIPTLARLYQVGILEPRQTNAVPDTRFNYALGLIREDITNLEVDVIVNSTNPSFSGIGVLDRTVFMKGGTALQEDCAKFGLCDEGDVKTVSNSFRIMMIFKQLICR